MGWAGRAGPGHERLYLALPHLSADLRVGSIQRLWIMDIYGFMIAGFLVTMGTLGDRIGRRRLLIGAAAFGVARDPGAAGGRRGVADALDFGLGRQHVPRPRAAGGGPTPALGTDPIVGSAPPEKAGSVASISETRGELGIALVVAIFGSVATAVYRGLMADAVLPGVPARTTEIARESITGAELLEGAREPFTAGLNTAVGVGAILFVGLAVLAATLIRSVRSGSGPEGRPNPK